MNKKMIYVLVCLFLALLVISYVQKSFDKATESPRTLNELGLSFEPDSVVKIDVYKQDYPDSGLHFVRGEKGWLVANEFDAPANETDVQKLIDDMKNISGSVRGESAYLFPEFDITDERALQVEFYDSAENKLVHLYVGKGGGGRECFVRMAGSPITYLANENFISRFAAWNAPPEKRLPADRWLDLKLCGFDRNDIQSFEIATGKQNFAFANLEEASEDTLTPPAKVWTQVSPEKGTKLEESKIRGLWSTISGLRAKGVDDPANRGKFGLDKPKYLLRVGDVSGKQLEMSVSDKINDEEDRYLVEQDRDAVYRIDKNTFERVFVKPFEKPK